MLCMYMLYICIRNRWANKQDEPSFIPHTYAVHISVYCIPIANWNFYWNFTTSVLLDLFDVFFYFVASSFWTSDQHIMPELFSNVFVKIKYTLRSDSMAEWPSTFAHRHTRAGNIYTPHTRTDQPICIPTSLKFETGPDNVAFRNGVMEFDNCRSQLKGLSAFCLQFIVAFCLFMFQPWILSKLLVIEIYEWQQLFITMSQISLSIGDKIEVKCECVECKKRHP